MAERFWVSGVLFHAAMVAASLVLARRWVRRVDSRPSLAAWRDAVGDALQWGSLAALLALVSAVVTAEAFAAIRLMSQLLFGELLLLLAWLAALLWRRRLARPALVTTMLALGLLTTYAEAYHITPHDLRVRHYAVDLTRGRPARGTLRLVHLSDLQANRIGAYERHALRVVAEQHADLIVMTGDYVQPRVGEGRSRTTADLKRLLCALPLHARLGVFAVRGDVDPEWPFVLARTPVVPLSGERVRLPLPAGGCLSLVGLTPSMSHGRSRKALLRLLEGAPPECLRIVLGHGPDYVMDLAGREEVDLALAGHTHGGQVVLPWLGAPYTKTRLPRRYASGLHDYQGIPLHVSAGIGMERGLAPQIRFLCPPEISVLTVSY